MEMTLIEAFADQVAATDLVIRHPTFWYQHVNNFVELHDS